MAETKWQPIATAPRDGTVVRLKRVFERRKITEGRGYFGDLTIRYGGFDYLAAVGDRRHEPVSEKTHIGVWIHEDRAHLFPTPTHWMPIEP